MRRLIVTLALLAVAAASAVSAAPPAASATCAEFCKRAVRCMTDAVAKEEGGRTMSEAEIDQGVAMCMQDCERGGDPPAMLGCLAARSCKDFVAAMYEKSNSMDACTPKGSAAIGKVLSLGVRTGDACTDRCRHQQECTLAATPTQTYERTKDNLRSCIADCTQYPGPAGYDACLAELACPTYYPGGSLAQAGAQECSRRANAQAAAPTASVPSTGPAASVPSTGPAASVPSTGPAASVPSTDPTASVPSTGPAASFPSMGPAATVAGRAPSGSPTPGAPQPSVFAAPNLEVVRIGPPIMSPACEWGVFVEPTTSALIFHREEWSPGGRSNRDLGWFRAPRTADGWGPLEPYPMPEGAGEPTLAANGETLYFTKATHDASGEQSFDLFLSRRTAGAWGVPESLGPVVNSPHNDETPTLSGDGNTLVFSSDRPGGAGYTDLWISTRGPDGAWTMPRNMGPGVNSQWHEGMPSLSTDGRTLYFDAADRPPPGLYMSTFDGENWSARRRLSPLLRGTVRYESRLTPLPDGREAIFQAEKPAITGDCTDLFLLRPAR